MQVPGKGGPIELRLINETKNLLLAERVRTVRGWGARLWAFLGRNFPAHGEALWLPLARGTHTWLRAGYIDVIFVDWEGQVLRVVDGLAPYKRVREARATSVVELPHGLADRVGTVPGDRLGLYRGPFRLEWPGRPKRRAGAQGHVSP